MSSIVFSSQNRMILIALPSAQDVKNSPCAFFFSPKRQACILQNEGRFIYLFIYACVCHQEVLSPDVCFCCPEPQQYRQPAAVRGGPEEAGPKARRPRSTACCHLPHPAPQPPHRPRAPLPILQFSYRFVIWHHIKPSTGMLSGRIYRARSEARKVPADHDQFGQSDNQDHLRLYFCHRNHTAVVPLQQPLAGRVTQKTQH